MRRDLATIEQPKASNRKASESFEDLDDDMRRSRLDGNPQCRDLSLYVTLSSFPLASRPIVCTAKWSLRHMQAAHSAALCRHKSSGVLCLYREGSFCRSGRKFWVSMSKPMKRLGQTLQTTTTITRPTELNGYLKRIPLSSL